MIRSYHSRGGRSLVFLWIFLHLCIVLEGRRYDKCLTKDGRQGVCVVKRYCREANHHVLLPCDGDAENHCCPIPTTQRSAASLRPEQPRPDEEEKKQRPVASREPDRDDRLNKTPPPGDRRSPSRHESDPPNKHPTRDKVDDYGSGRYRPAHPLDNPEDYPPDRHGHDGSPSRHENDPPKKHPTRDKVDDYGSGRYRPAHPLDNPEDYPPDRHGHDGSPSRHENDPPKKHPTRDKVDDYGSGRYRPAHQLDNPEDYPPDRHGHDGDARHTRPSARPTNTGRHDRPSRRPNDDRIYPTKRDPETAARPEPPRRESPRKEVPDDSLKAGPIRFPEPYEFSVPSPKVPACGVKPYDLFIAGGEESDEHEWPWMTAIFRRHPDSRPKTFLCGGSLINTKYVLTAAHCFVNNYVILPASSFVVRLGSHFLNSGEEYTVSNLVLHHNHSGSDFFNDIALVRLASEVFVTDKVAPICLPDPGMIYENFIGRMATVAGWGDTSFRTGHTRILQHVTVPIVSGEECFAAYSRVRGAAFLARGSDHVICAGLREGGKDACLGDSGGPLMLKMPDDRWVVVGIVSLGYKCAEPGYPGVYTRVTHYLSWINTNMKRH